MFGAYSQTLRNLIGGMYLMLNRITVMGRLVRDPELRRTQNDIPVCSFSVACDRDVKDKATGERATDFIDIVAWHRRVRVQVSVQGPYGRHRRSAPAQGLDGPGGQQAPQRRDSGQQRQFR